MKLRLPSGLKELLFRRRNDHLVSQAADQISQQCRICLWQQIQPRMADMSVAEIRGYAKARAAGYVDAEVDHLLSCWRLEPALRNRIADAATDQLIALIVHDVLSGESSANPRTMAA